MSRPKVVSPEEWLAARKQLLAKEKELTDLQDALAEERRTLPWVRVATPYRFEGPSGPESLSDLFRGHSQLVVYHFMFGPGWEEGCPGCSLLADHLDGAALHLGARDVALAVVSRAPYADIAPFQRRMGWRFHWVSSYGTDFNRDHKVSFTKEETASGQSLYNFGTSGFPSEEAPGISVFCKDGDAVFHTYSTYGRGPEPLLGVYYLLDIVPKGRDEAALPYPMAWVRHHDRYESATPA